MKKIILSIFLIVLNISVFCQTAEPFYIRGKITDATTSEALPYASIQIKNTTKGTISDAAGNFSLEWHSNRDTLQITSVGYLAQLVPVAPVRKYYEIKMQENSQLLGEVTITAKEIDLYGLVVACAKNDVRREIKAKSYYQLKSFVNDRQVELMEAYYNAGLKGYDIAGLALKNGRIALQAFDDQFFLSTESSSAITRLQLFQHNEYFPRGPFEMPENKMRKNFRLALDKVYEDDKGQEIYQVDFTPLKDSAASFSGKIWINFQKKQVIKVQLSAMGTKIHPFKPLFPDDTIQCIDLDITRTYREIDGKMFFNHVDFDYKVHYKSRRSDNSYIVNTNAVLYAYAPGETFILPKFEFAEMNHTDYRKINAMPYDAFFWDKLDEFRLIDDKNNNRLFYEDEATITNRTMFGVNPYLKRGFLEHPFVRWDGVNRIKFMQYKSDSLSNNEKDMPFTAELYNLSVKIYLDMSPSGDTLHWITATVFDPYETFYKLPVNDTALCFINTYFDIMELQRRELESALRSGTQSVDSFNQAYADAQESCLLISRKYFKEVDRGTNKTAMLQWNDYVFQRLGIDNVKIFKPFPSND